MNMLQGPIYDPKSKVRKFNTYEDLENIRFAFSGSGKLYCDPNFHYYLGDLKDWKRPKEICSSPKFINGKPDRFDALQGRLGDCWFIAAMESLTLREKLIEHVVPSDQSFDRDYVGAFHFRIWQLGTWYDVVVDDRLPVYLVNNKPCFARSRSGDVFWACLLEKAYAKVCGNSYENLAGGFGTTAFQELTGGIIEEFYTQHPPPETTVKMFISLAFSDDALICGSTSDVVDSVRPDIQGSHVYSVTDVIKCDDHDPEYPGLFLLRLMNPNVIPEWRGKWSDSRLKEIDEKLRRKMKIVDREDGEFWMGESDFIQYFEMVQVCHLGPGQYVSSRQSLSVGIWKTTTFWGEWVKNVSAGGSDISSRHQNPQYRIILELKDDWNKDNLCSVVIELTQRSKFDRDLIRDLAFYVYSLKGVSNPPIPLDYNFFQKNKAINEDNINKTMNNQRSYVFRAKLDPGKYCIVPCTLMENEEQQFLLRVFSESLVEAWEYDTQISKSLPLEEETSKEINKIQRFFYHVAGGKDEIDWIGVRDILVGFMNDDASPFTAVRTFLILTWKMLRTVLLDRTSNSCDSDDKRFSKEDCRSMIAMLDYDHSGKLSFPELCRLFKKICFWTDVYNRFIATEKGTMSVSRLKDALSSIGYNLSTQILHKLIHQYANDHGEISIPDFIMCGIKLETGLFLYQKNTSEAKDIMIFKLEEWVEASLQL